MYKTKYITQTKTHEQSYAHKHCRHVLYSCLLYVGLAVLQVRLFLTLVLSHECEGDLEAFCRACLFSYLWESCFSAHWTYMSSKKNSKHPIRQLLSMRGKAEETWKALKGTSSVGKMIILLLLFKVNEEKYMVFRASSRMGNDLTPW